MDAECCSGCTCSRAAAIPREVEQAEIAIVFDFPTEREAKRGWLKGAQGSGSELMSQILKGLGVDRDEVYICSALNCRPNPKKTMKPYMLACRKRLIRELRAAGVKKVLAMGPVAYSSIVSADKVLPITKVRGRWKKAYGMNVLGTVGPGLCIAEPGFFRDMIRDIEKFFTTDEALPDPEVDLWIPTTLAEADEAYKFIETYGFHSMDIETDGLSHVDNEMTAFGLGVIEPGTDGMVGHSVVINQELLGRKRTWKRIQRLLNGELETVWHNGKFDLKFFKAYFEEHDLVYRPQSVHDTMLLHYTTDERGGGGEAADGKSNKNKFKCHGLETLARQYYDAPDYEIGMKQWLKDWEKADTLARKEMQEQLHVYLGLDVYYTARLFPDLWNMSLKEDEGLIEVYEDLLIPGMLALTDVEYHGILIDQPMYEATREELQTKVDGIKRKILREIKQKGFPDPEFNPKSPPQVQKLLYDKLGISKKLVDEEGNKFYVKRGNSGGEGSSSAHVLRALTHRYPEHKDLLENIMEYRNITKNIGTYLTGLLEKLHSDGRLRGSFNVHGTETGRLSSSQPNLQNIPDTDHTGINVRGGFVAPEGFKLIEADYSQLEVRIAAELSGDPVMKEVFDSGRDVHSEISQLMYQMPADQIDSYMRMLGKNILFGLLYGRGAESVALGPEQEEVARKRGAKWSVEEVQSFFGNLLEEWVVYAEWQQAQKKQGYEKGWIQLPSGRRRRFPFIPKHDGGTVARCSFNTPIQGTASDFTLYSLIQLVRILPEFGWHVILTVHDSIMCEGPEHNAEEVADLIERIMTEQTFFKTNVPLKVKTKISDRWDWKQIDSRGTKAKRSVLK